MADYGFGDPNAAMATNPYLQPQQAPDWRQVLGNALLGVGAGISGADSSGRGWGQGIAPGLMMGNQMTQNQQQQLFQRQIQAAQWQQMDAYRKAQEENMRSQIAERELGMNIDKRIAGQLDGAPPGMSVPASPPRMGPDLKQAGAPMVDYLTQKHGFSPVAAASTVGNLYQESGFNPGVVGDGGKSTGMAQWDPQRYAGLVNFAKAQGKPVNDPNVQLDYLVTEMKGGDMGAQRAYALLQQAKNPQEGTAALMHFFRPAGYTPANPSGGHAFNNRVQYAQALMPNGQPVPQGEGGPPGSPAGSGGTMVPPPQPQQSFNGPPGASAGIDPLSQQMLISKRFGPLGQARVTNQNQQFTQELERQKFLYQQQEDAQKAAQSAANQDVNLVNGQPVVNSTAVEAKKAISAAQGTDPSSKITLELAQDAIKRNSEWQKAGTAAGGTLRNIDIFSKLSDEVKSGKFMGSVTDLKAALKGSGVNLEAWGIPDNVGPAQAMQMMSQRFALEMRQEMPGPMSDGDRKFMERGALSIEKDPNANKIMAAWLKGSAERSQDRAKFAREYTRSADFKNDPAGIDDYVEQKLAGKDYFDHSVLSSKESTAPAPAQAPVQAVPIPRGAIKDLMMDPKRAEEFDRKYGPGAAARTLGGGK